MRVVSHRGSKRSLTQAETANKTKPFATTTLVPFKHYYFQQVTICIADGLTLTVCHSNYLFLSYKCIWNGTDGPHLRALSLQAQVFLFQLLEVHGNQLNLCRHRFLGQQAFTIFCYQFSFFVHPTDLQRLQGIEQHHVGLISWRNSTQGAQAEVAGRIKASQLDGGYRVDGQFHCPLQDPIHVPLLQQIFRMAVVTD